MVGRSDEFGSKEVRPLEYFGTQLVGYRTESGRLVVLDGYCPHLGAHLGMGGKVSGERIECPFHAWCFDPEGACVSIPYATRIPKKARTQPWRTREIDGHVFVWHPRVNKEPTYEVPALPGHDTDQWQGWSGKCLRIDSTPWEIVENLADKAHFPVVHRAGIEFFENEFKGPIAVQRTKGRGIDDVVGEDTSFESTATYYGPSYLVTEMDARPAHRLLLAHTPVDEGRVDLRVGVSIRKRGNEEWLEQMESLLVSNILRAMEEDIAIWKHKVYREQPVLSDADGPIGKLRKWYTGFYGEPMS